MGKQMNEDKEQMIKHLRKRLDWYIYQSADEEYNEEEVCAMIDLLKVLDPPKVPEDFLEPENALKRFWDSFEERQEMEEEFERLKVGESKLSDFPDPDGPILDEKAEMKQLLAQLHGYEDLVSADTANKKTKKTNRKVVPFRSGKVAKVAVAAVLVFAMLLSGTAGAYAEKEGFFHWIKRGEDGYAFVTSPDAMELDSNYREYKSFDEMPVEYHNIVWRPSALTEEFELEYVSLRNLKVMTEIGAKYAYSERSFVWVMQKIFLGEVTILDAQFDSYSYLETLKCGDIEVYFYQADNEGMIEYVGVFFLNNQEYCLRSNLEISKVREIITKSLEV